MGLRYRLEPRLTTPIGFPRALPLRRLLGFRDAADRGLSHVETTGIPKATEASFRAAPSACSEIIRQC